MILAALFCFAGLMAFICWVCVVVGADADTTDEDVRRREGKMK